MRSVDYGRDVLGNSRRRAIPEVFAEPGLVVETAAGDFCGAVIRVERNEVELEDRHGRRRVFTLRSAGFQQDGRLITLVPTRTCEPAGPSRSASGSVRVPDAPARMARASRIWVEGVHDAELVERVWGHDLRVEGVVVEPLHGLDDLSATLAEFGPAAHRRVGVLVDHLVTGSKETDLVRQVQDDYVLITGHPYVDVWEAVRPEAVGIVDWPQVPRGTDWKEGACELLGWSGVPAGWRHILRSVSSYRDLRTPMISAMEQLIDFVSAAGDETG